MLILLSKKPSRELIPFLAFKQPAASLGRTAAPLLEEKCDARMNTLITDVDYPCLIHRPRARTALATDNHPVNAAEVEFADRRKKRLDREEADANICALQVRNARCRLSVLNRDAKPNVPGRGTFPGNGC